MSPNKFDVNKNYYPKAPLLPALLRALCFFLLSLGVILELTIVPMLFSSALKMLR